MSYADSVRSICASDEECEEALAFISRATFGMYGGSSVMADLFVRCCIALEDQGYQRAEVLMICEGWMIIFRRYAFGLEVRGCVVQYANSASRGYISEDARRCIAFLIPRWEFPELQNGDLAEINSMLIKLSKTDGIANKPQ